MGSYLAEGLCQKHFKMYITIIDIIDKKRIDLDYLIRGKDIAVVSVFSDNINYEFTKPWTLDFGSSSKLIVAGTYRRQLIDIVEGIIELAQFHKDSRIKRINKSEGIMEMIFKYALWLEIPTKFDIMTLSEGIMEMEIPTKFDIMTLSEGIMEMIFNLENESPSNITYHVTDFDDSK